MSSELIATARRLANYSAKKPRQADLRRAVSTAYYALFHTLAKECADRFIGSSPQHKSKAWSQVYRALDHGMAKKSSQQVAKMGFPAEIIHFADTFSRLQEHRHNAHYSPDVNYIRSDVLLLITEAENAIKQFRQCKARDRTAYVVLVLLKSRGG